MLSTNDDDDNFPIE